MLVGRLVYYVLMMVLLDKLVMVVSDGAVALVVHYPSALVEDGLVDLLDAVLQIDWVDLVEDICQSCDGLVVHVVVLPLWLEGIRHSGVVDVGELFVDERDRVSGVVRPFADG